MRTDRAVARFWSKVTRSSGCWLWRGYRKSLYGSIMFKRRAIGAHVFSYMLAHALDAPPALLVLHTCDTPLCVNPQHLFLGTHKDNYEDMRQKGRAHINKNGRRGNIAAQ